MRKIKNLIIFLVLFMVIGYATISVSLSISGKNIVASNLDQFKVYFSSVRINGEEDLRVVKNEKEIQFDFSLGDIGSEKVIEYDVTNGSSVFDAKLSISCTSGNEYLSVTNEFDTSELEALATRTGALTLKKLRSNATGDTLSYSVSCRISASPIERESIGSGNLLSPAVPVSLEIGEGISIDGEVFNIISINEDSVTMLAKYNLGPNYRQSEEANPQFFTTEPDWMGETTSRDLDIQSYDGPVKTYVNEYVKYLKQRTGTDDVTGTLITQNELVNLGCVMTYPGYGLCDSSNYVEWILNSQAWYTRTTFYDDGFSRVIAVTTNQIADGEVDDPNDGWGIRPVITIPMELARIYSMKQYNIGEILTIDTEEFYVLKDNGFKLTLLSRYNLNSDYRQSEELNQFAFANSGIAAWPGTGYVDIDIQKYDGNVKNYVNGYVDFLNLKSENSIISGDLMTVRDLEDFECSVEISGRVNVDCSDSVFKSLFVNGQDWWFASGFSVGSADTYFMTIDGNIYTDDYEELHGIRPVIVVKKDFFE